MEFPFGHGHHHHHHHPETNELDPDSYPPPPQPGHYQPPYGYDGPPPPPPAQQHQPFGYDGPPPGHQPYGGVGGGYGYNPLPPTVSSSYGGPPPPVVEHVSHEVGGGGFFGHHHHHQSRPQEYGGIPPPPVVEHVSHEGGGGGFFGHHHHHQSRPQEYGGIPPPPVVEHVSDEGGGGGFFGHHHHNQSRPQEYGGSYVQHVGHEGGSAGRKPTVRIYTKADENYSLSIRDGKVVLAKANHTDPCQHWIKDLKYSTKVKDEEGFPSFSLINKVTGEALKHSIGATHPVRLVPYNADYLDESILWTESKDLGDGFRCIRMVNNIRLNFDAFHGDEDHGGVHDGTILVLWEWLKGKNQRWKIVPY